MQVVEIGTTEDTFDVAFDASTGSMLKKLSVKTLKPKGNFAMVDGVAANLKPMLDNVLTPTSTAMPIDDLLQVNPAGTKILLKSLPLGGLGTYTVEVSGASQSVGYALLKASIKIPRSREIIQLP